MKEMNIGVTETTYNSDGSIKEFGGHYTPPKRSFSGITVFAAQNPQTINRDDGKECSMWVPYIGVAIPQNKKAVTVAGKGVSSKDALFYDYRLLPNWGKDMKDYHKYFENIITLQGAFVPEEITQQINDHQKKNMRLDFGVEYGKENPSKDNSQKTYIAKQKEIDVAFEKYFEEFKEEWFRKPPVGDVAIMRLALNLSQVYYGQEGKKAFNTSWGYSSRSNWIFGVHGKEEELEDMLRTVIGKINYASYDNMHSGSVGLHSHKKARFDFGEGNLSNLEALVAIIVYDVKKPADEKKWIEPEKHI